jgi:predicted O-methyltransferase YrrM
VNVRRVGHILAYPVRYAGVLQAWRRLRRNTDLAPEEALEFARSFSWYQGDNISPTQQDTEILGVLGLLRERPPRAVVEVGTDKGGTLFLWSRVAAPDAILVAIDNHPLGALGTRSAWAAVRRCFARAQQRVDLLIPRDSHDPRTVDEVRQRLEGRPVDFVFIDGDHEYEGVKRDFELYSPLVRPGGLIAFHDINEMYWPGVGRLWDELKPHHETVEFVANDPPRRWGIGVIRVGGADAQAAA